MYGIMKNFKVNNYRKKKNIDYLYKENSFVNKTVRIGNEKIKLDNLDVDAIVGLIKLKNNEIKFERNTNDKNNLNDKNNSNNSNYKNNSNNSNDKKNSNNKNNPNNKMDRKNRKNYTQSYILNNVFSYFKFPSKELKSDLSILLSMPLKEIQGWFQNARQTEKKEGNIFLLTSENIDTSSYLSKILEDFFNIQYSQK